MTTKEAQLEQFEYKAEMKQLLHLIIHSLYTHPEVFLRELISNASDALNKVHFRQLTDQNIFDPGAELKIKIDIDSKRQKFSIEDSGIGMTREELINNIGTIAKSGTLEFLKKIKEEKKSIDGNLIGQFGVGFYSVFMVTDEVTIETRQADPDSQGYKFTSKGENTFTIEEIDKKSRGTKISFTLKDEHKEFSEEYKVKQIVNKYSNFVDFPIFIGKDKINTVTPLWQKTKDQVKEEDLNEFYKYLSNDFETPLGHLLLSIEGNINFKALIFIPQKASPLIAYAEQREKSLQLYCNKILVQDDCKDLLPEYLRFVKGVVDTEDLPLNVSREVTQSSPVMAKIKKVLTGKILAFLEGWAQNETEKYETFYKQFNPILKMGISTDFSNKDKLVDLLRFESTLTEKGKFTSLKKYTSNMRENQKEIYYLAGDHRDILEKNPNLEYFKKNGIEVLLLTEPVDAFIMPSINEYEKKALKSIDKEDIDLSQDNKKEELQSTLSQPLLKTFKEILIDKVEDVVASKRLVDSAVTLVVSKKGLDPQMEKMMKFMNKDYTESKKILEVNLSHPLVKNISKLYEKNKKDPLIKSCILQLCEGAMLIDNNLKSPADFVNRMTTIMEEATKKE